MLRAIGWVLVVDDPVRSADVVVVPVWAAEAGGLEAASLVRIGVSNRVAVVPVVETPAERELVRRGVPHDSGTARMASLLVSLGVADVERLPNAVAGTEDEGEMLAIWCDEHHFRSVVVVSTPDHARRLRRVLRRSMKDRPTLVSVRSARYASFDPDRWWQTRDGVRTEVVELQKLVLDVARHPFS